MAKQSLDVEVLDKCPHGGRKLRIGKKVGWFSADEAKKKLDAAKKKPADPPEDEPDDDQGEGEPADDDGDFFK